MYAHDWGSLYRVRKNRRDRIFCANEYGYLPKTLDGSETTYLCDKVWGRTSDTGYALVGGRWTLGTGCGARSFHFCEPHTNAATYTCARISYLAP